MGRIDRVLRVLVGLALLAGFLVDRDASYRWAYLIGLVPLATGLTGTCPAYRLLGINTCRPTR